MSFTKSVYTVWLRYVAVFRKNILYGIVTTFVEPLLYLFSFGFGLGSYIGQIHSGENTSSYRAFVLAGLVGQSVLFTAFFDGAYGGFIRMYYQKVFQAIAVTPVTLSEVLWGELLWSASRSLLSTLVILLIGAVIGDFQLSGLWLVIPIAFIGALVFGALGMLAAAMSRTIESLSYPQYLFIFPMFLFCGVYFPLTNLPKFIQLFAQILPLTAMLSITRTAVLGFDFEPWAPVVLLAWLAVFVPLARSKMMKRLVA
jgi:lipooligosaccharide transport system permease protein